MDKGSINSSECLNSSSTDEHVVASLSNLSINTHEPVRSSRSRDINSIFVPSNKKKFAMFRNHRLKTVKPKIPQSSDTLELPRAQIPAQVERPRRGIFKGFETQADSFFSPKAVDDPVWNKKTGLNDLSDVLLPQEVSPRALPVQKEKSVITNVLQTISVSKISEHPRDLKIPGLETTLLPHQLIGVDFLQKRELGCSDYNGYFGGLLCDDMGLGKTVQIITLMAYNLLSSPTLIICPASLTTQWLSEINRFIPRLKVLLYHGPKRPKNFADLMNYDVVISSFDTIRSEYVKFVGQGQDYVSPVFYRKMKWGRVVLDEAHTIANKKSKTAQACYEIAATRRWCLTGTPIQNNLDDLQSLLKFLQVSRYADEEEWKKDISEAMVAGHINRVSQLLTRELEPVMLRRTKAILASFTESHDGSTKFKGLPPKIVHFEVLNFTPVQQKIYDYLNYKYFKKVSRQVNDFSEQLSKRGIRINNNEIEKRRDLFLNEQKKHEINDECFKAQYEDLLSVLSEHKIKLKSKEAGDMGKVRIMILVYLLRLRQLCCHWELLTHGIDSKSGKVNDVPEILYDSDRLRNTPTKKQATDDFLVHEFMNLKLNEEKKSVSFEKFETPTKDQAIEKIEGLKILQPSAKVERVVEILLKEKHFPGSKISRKTIIFSQFTQMLKLIEEKLKVLKIGHSCYFGAMSIAEKDASKNKFAKDLKCEVMLCALKSGSLGLNLVMADRVILFDPWWNPAVQDQAIDRVYRIGQTSRQVDVHILVMKNTVEEEIIKLQEHKKNLAKMVIEGDKNAVKKLSSGLSTRELLKLFGIVKEW